jgi:hypothetical protein
MMTNQSAATWYAIIPLLLCFQLLHLSQEDAAITPNPQG